jgi:tRNA-dihydrouridine synthase B
LKTLKANVFNPQNKMKICLAPMVGLSHVVLREIVRGYMPSGANTIWPTEMLNSRRIPNENLKQTPETLRNENEDYLVPQILGNEERFIEPSVKKLVEEWGASGIDINMGCPVQKALKHNYGVSLMGDIKYASEVVAITVKHSKVPVSVKLRAGFQSDLKFLIEFCKSLENAGASWLTLHPRTVEQKRRGQADWSQIKKLKNELGIPLIGNGDVQTCEDALQMLDQTDCDMVMVGRALTARPWLVWQMGEKLGMSPPTGREKQMAPSTAFEEGEEYGRVLLKYIELSYLHFSESLASRKIRFFVKTSSVWLQFGHALCTKLSVSQSQNEMQQVVTQFFSQPQAMNLRTELRQ